MAQRSATAEAAAIDPLHAQVVLKEELLELVGIAACHHHGVAVEVGQQKVIRHVYGQPGPLLEHVDGLGIGDRQLIEDLVGDLVPDEVAVKAQVAVHCHRHDAHGGIIAD